MALQHSKVGVTETFDFKFLLHYPGSFAETNKKLSRLRSGRHEWNCADGGTCEKGSVGRMLLVP